MRIITGSAKSIPLKTLEGEDTRPTLQRVKEAVFSMIQFDIEGRNVLDLFAGSGQMGLEALSRGAKNATFVDKNREAAQIIIENAQKAKLFKQCNVLATDYQIFLKGCIGKEKFDIIFLDPPYKSDFTYKTLEFISENDILAPNGIIICESESGIAHGKHRTHKEIVKKELENAVNDSIFRNDKKIQDCYNVSRLSLYGRAMILMLTKGA